MKSPIITSAELLDLAQNLRNVGFTLEIRQVLNAQRLDSLMLALAAEGEELTSARLCRLLAPIFSTSAEEQQTFYAYFDEWLSRKPEIRSRLGDGPGEHERVGGEPQPPQRRLWPWLVVAAVLAGATIVLWQSRQETSIDRPRSFPVSLHVRDALDSTALVGAEIAMPQDTLFTDSTGSLHLESVPSDSMLSFSIVLDDFLTKRTNPFAVSDTIKKTFQLYPNPGSGPQSLSGHVASQSNQTPVKDATVRFMSEQATTDARGGFAFNYMPRDSIASLTVTHNDFKNFNRSIPLNGHDVSADLRLPSSQKTRPGSTV